MFHSVVGILHYQHQAGQDHKGNEEQEMTTKELADILVRGGLVDPRAVEDPEGYDGGETMCEIGIEAQEIIDPPELAALAKAAIDWSNFQEFALSTPQSAYVRTMGKLQDAAIRYTEAVKGQQ
jgi:hypothetical protein